MSAHAITVIRSLKNSEPKIMRRSILNLPRSRVPHCKYSQGYAPSGRDDFILTFGPFVLWGAAVARDKDAIPAVSFLCFGFALAPSMTGLFIVASATGYNIKCIFWPKLTSEKKMEAEAALRSIAASPKQ